MIKVIFCILALPILTFGWAQRFFFTNFPNYYWVETGTEEGHGIYGVLSGGGFQEYHSIELSERYYDRCQIAFKDLPNVHLWLGDSGKILENITRNMDKPITFWLDAHWSGAQTSKGETNSAIMQELEAIKKHAIKTHTILIDDVRLFGTAEMDFVSLDDVKKKIKEINPGYEFSLWDGAFPQDILVARVPKSYSKK